MTDSICMQKWGIHAIERELKSPGTGKTQTRLIVIPQPDAGQFFGSVTLLPDQRKAIFRNACGIRQDIKAPYAPGDLIWVREEWLHIDDENDKFDGLGSQTYYRADQTPRDEDLIRKDGLKWSPAADMPRWASRLTLKVTRVRCERLQDINGDALREEGLDIPPGPPLSPRETKYWKPTFADLWNSLHGPGAWDKNPWVWAIRFQPIARDD